MGVKPKAYSAASAFRFGVLAFLIGITMLVFGLLTGSATLSDIGIYAPLQMNENASINGLIFSGIVLSSQFAMGAAISMLIRAVFLVNFDQSKDAPRNVALARWLLDLKPLENP